MLKIAVALVALTAATPAFADCGALRTVRSQVDCENGWMLSRAINTEGQDTDVLAAYSLLRLALAAHQDAGELTLDTYTRMDALALEMLMSTIGVRRGDYVRRK